MWLLKTLSKEKENEYLNISFKFNNKTATLKEHLENQIKNSACSAKVKKYLKDNLNTLLVGKPQDLYKSLNFFLNNRREYKNIEKVFKYNSFISDRKVVSYKIAKIIGVPVCVYCNRQYIFTVEKIVRPQFDHYLPKSIYPFFALSLYNLIPSCSICNSLKSDKDINRIESIKDKNFEDIKMNPYINKGEVDDLFKFSYYPNKYGEPEKIKIIQTRNKDYQKKVEFFLDLFKIEKIYSAHAGFEVKDLYTFATKYSDTYLQSLLEQIGLYYRLSQEDAYRILFGTELYSKNDNNRPLSKLKRDLLEELGVIPKK